MKINKFIYPIFVVNDKNERIRYCGTCFPITPKGGLITCRHVVDKKLESTQKLVIWDGENNAFIPIAIDRIRFQEPYDLAYIPNVLGAEKQEYFPILTPLKILIGADAITIGKYAVGGIVSAVDQGFFRGSIVNIFRYPERANAWTLGLPYPVIEGLSGSPVHTYHNSTKLIGICYGSIAQRVLASEVTEINDQGKVFEEKVHRIVELGLAYHAIEVIQFLTKVGVNDFVVAEDRVVVPNLDD